MSPWARMLVDLMLGLSALIGCAVTPSAQAQLDYQSNDVSPQAFSQPLAGLQAARRALFDAGKREFEQRWVPFPAIGGTWGRGPLFNAESCAQCHPGNGRGSTRPDPEAGLVSMVARLGDRVARSFDPNYGQQINTHGILGRVPAEGRVAVNWHEHRVRLFDGSAVVLRAPAVEIKDLAYGPLAQNTRLSLRIAPQLVGMGLLEQVSDDELEALRALQRPSGHEGRINWLRDPVTQLVAGGRFGWKAARATLRQQIAHAFIEDMGVTSAAFRVENCTPVQRQCRHTDSVTAPELEDSQWEALTAFLAGLAVPKARAPDRQGEMLFAQLHCDRCHVPTLRVAGATPGTIAPYSDLMLHAMGPALADEVAESSAHGDEWRTPPLWGLGLLAAVNDNVFLLHDGRARDAEEAILWHGGQAARSMQAYRRLARTERAALLRFLNSL